MSSIRPLIPLLIAAGILLGGNGLQGTLIALRGAEEGFSPATIGFMGTAYFGGFLLGCIFITRIMKAVGHVRSFSALAAIASAGTLMLVLVIDPVMWSAIRFATGFCFAGLFTVMESWLNSGVQNHDRARVLALYRIIDIGSVTGAQFLIPVFGADGFTIFAIMSIMITLSLVPVSLGDRSNPHRAGRREARPWPRLAYLSARLHRLHRGRRDEQRVPHALACLCRADRHVGHRCRDLRQHRHHRRRDHPVSARPFLRPLGQAKGSAHHDRRGDACRACAGFPGWNRPARQFRAGFRVRLVRHAAVFAVGRPRQRPRRQRRVRAGERRADAVLFVRSDRRPACRFVLHAAFRAAVAVHLLRDRLRAFHPHHSLPHAGSRRRPGQPARPLHRAAAHLHDLCQADAPERRLRQRLSRRSDGSRFAVYA